MEEKRSYSCIECDAPGLKDLGNEQFICEKCGTEQVGKVVSTRSMGENFQDSRTFIFKEEPMPDQDQKKCWQWTKRSITVLDDPLRLNIRKGLTGSVKEREELNLFAEIEAQKPKNWETILMLLNKFDAKQRNKGWHLN